MAFIKLYRNKLKHNYQFLQSLFGQQNIQWGIVTKLLCGNQKYIEEVINLGITELCDSRISNLKLIKKINKDITTVYIKPPAKRSIKSIVTYADVSLNTEYFTIKLLSEEAQRQDKTHRVVIMLELGDLREGVMREEIIDFYEKIFQLPNIKVVGLGTNLNCLHGVMPSEDKLIQLSLYKQIIELKFKRQIPFISAGTTVTLPLLLHKQLPDGVNHFRLGEALFWGNNLFDNSIIDGMETDVLELFAEIIEVNEKPIVPAGVLAENPSGEVFELNEEDFGRTTFRGILDVGLLDINPDFLIPQDKGLEVVGASSDMLILDLKDNKKNYKVGDLVAFKLKYMGALGLLNSNYIEKVVE
ncbi:alanine/ornithine racemase family PLP-dependent enzyme [uncultured Microscilla sp.]|uniref:alanine/ornithine racemase family PLP-dependent enzyme n=1 Tax=uncultured Microscilla sp. TaxID=432653 RepID=UPI00262B31E8|nr:alanine/ornithine racemase family PLP-dependent enzyme [uncultured Microscilla sp.]